MIIRGDYKLFYQLANTLDMPRMFLEYIHLEKYYRFIVRTSIYYYFNNIELHE